MEKFKYNTIDEAIAAIKAGQIAVDTVKKYFRETGSQMEVVFNVFKEKDWEIYNRLLERD